MKNYFLPIVAAFASGLSASAYDADNLYVIGNASNAGWELPAKIEMTREGANRFTWTGALSRQGEFKFLVRNNWDPCITSQFETAGVQHTAVTDHGSYDLYVRPDGNTGEDNKFKVTVSGIYTLNVNLDEMKMNVTLDEEIIDLYIAGGATDGDWVLENALSSQRMNYIGDGHYTWTGNLKLDNPDDPESGRFRFISQNDWWNNSYTTTGDSHEDVGLGEYDIRHCDGMVTGEPAFRIKETGKYIVDIDIRNNRMTISESPIYIMGNALNAGPSNWDLSWAQACRPIGTTPHEFEWEGKLYSVGADNQPAEFKFLCQNTQYNPCYVAASEAPSIETGQSYSLSMDYPDYKFTVPQDGFYRLVVNTEKRTMDVTYLGTAGIASVTRDDAGVTVTGRRLDINAGVANVYDALGRLIAADVTTIELPAPAIYIVKTDSRVYKIAVK